MLRILFQADVINPLKANAECQKLQVDEKELKNELK